MISRSSSTESVIKEGKITLMDFIPVDGITHVIEVDDDDDDQHNFVYEDEEEEEEVEDQDVEMTPDESKDTGDDAEPSERELKRRKISTLLDALTPTADMDGVCVVCRSVEHTLDACAETEADNVKETLKKMRETLLLSEPAKEKPSSSKKPKSKTGGSVGGKIARARIQGNEVFTMFERPVTMVGIGDQEEGGKYLVNNVNIGEYGPKNRKEMEDLLDNALEQSRSTVLPDIAQLLDGNYESINKNHLGYAKIDVRLFPPEKKKPELTKIFGVDTVPLEGCQFHAEPWLMSCFMDKRQCKRQTTNYEDQVGHNVGRKLRHGVGAEWVPKYKGQEDPKVRGLQCDEGYWVNIEHLLGLEPLFLMSFSDRNPNDRWKNFHSRLRNIVKVTESERHHRKRLRFEILALTASPADLKRFPDFCKNHKIDIDAIFSEDPIVGPLKNVERIFLKPLAIRATMGHTSPKDSIHFQPWRTSLKISRQCALQLGGAYHTTTVTNLFSIMRYGLIPGGGKGRVTSFVLPFGPWDSRSVSLVKKARNFPGETRICLFFGSDILEEYACRITQDGNIVTQHVIPFNQVSAMWIEWALPPEPWVRLLVRTEQTHVISSIQDCNKVASLEKGISMLKTVIEEVPAKYDEFKAELVKIKNEHESKVNVLVPQDKTWDDMVSLMSVCYMANEANHILCPGCLEETPRKLSMCLNCYGVLVSHGTLTKAKVAEEGDDIGKTFQKHQTSRRKHVRQMSRWRSKNPKNQSRMTQQMTMHHRRKLAQRWKERRKKVFLKTMIQMPRNKRRPLDQGLCSQMEPWQRTFQSKCQSGMEASPWKLIQCDH